MGVTVKVVGAGDGEVAKVTTNAGVRVVTVPRPPKDYSAAEVGQVRELREVLLDPEGSEDMSVNGSSTAQVFYIEAEADRIKWVKRVSLVMHDQQMSTETNQELRRFGQSHAAPGLTNGLKLTVTQDGQDTEIFSETEGGNAGVRSLVQFYRFGEVIGKEGAISTSIDFVQVNVDFYAERGVGLYPGSKDRIFFTVQDDLTGLDLMEAVALGTYEVL
jgi:hypothetical protein